MLFYLWKRNSTFYYRIKIPSDLSHIFPCSLLRISLKTRHSDAAKTAAANIHSRVQNTFALLRTEALPPEQVGVLISSILPSKRSFMVVEGSDSPEDNLNLSEAIQQFIADKGVRWTGKTNLEFTCMFDVLVDVMGDPDVGLLTRADGLSCRDRLMRLPANFRKKRQYRGMSVSEILDTEPEDTLSPKTINKYLVLLSSLCKWCVKNGMMATNIAEGLNLPEETSAHEQRSAYSVEDLKRIKANLPRIDSEPEKFWIPMIAMYSGMRLDEICQLHLEEIKEVDGILCFDVNDIGERKVKTNASKRIVPVHPELASIGFVEYVDQQRARCAVQLWENLSPNKYGYWGKNFGKWYGTFNRQHVTSDPLKVFHSFRHTVADTLKQKGVAEGIIGEILGHANGSITTGRYGKRYRPGVLLDALKLLAYK
ncbi:MAG: site-specific integrase [Desulfuromonadales bacterium]